MSCLKDINAKEVTFNPHIFKRKHRNIDLDRIRETIASKSIFPKKCKPPYKLCFKRYFGKINRTYYVIARLHEDFVEVITTWHKKGKR